MRHRLFVLAVIIGTVLRVYDNYNGNAHRCIFLMDGGPKTYITMRVKPNAKTICPTLGSIIEVVYKPTGKRGDKGMATKVTDRRP